MNSHTPKLTLKSRSEPEEPPVQDLLAQAMREHLCVRATYSRGLVRLAPHILYRRHDAPFLDAVVVERDGAAPAESKLGSFRLSALKGVAVTMEAFTPLASFDPTDERYDTTIAVIEIS